MSIQFDIAKQIIAETCPNRKLKLENTEYKEIKGNCRIEFQYMKLRV